MIILSKKSRIYWNAFNGTLDKRYNAFTISECAWRRIDSVQLSLIPEDRQNSTL